MAIDPAVNEALEATLAEVADQSEDFKKRFRWLVTRVLSDNYGDSDVRNVMDIIHVVEQSED